MTLEKFLVNQLLPLLWIPRGSWSEAGKMEREKCQMMMRMIKEEEERK